MIAEKYLAKIKEILEKHLQSGDRVFIFGSSVDSDNFGDIDLAIVSDREDLDRSIMYIRELLEESTLPYKFDLVNFNKAKDSFRNRVMSGPKIWII